LLPNNTYKLNVFFTNSDDLFEWVDFYGSKNSPCSQPYPLCFSTFVHSYFIKLRKLSKCPRNNLIASYVLGDEDENKTWIDECADTKCPTECVCEGGVVDCSNRGFREIPQDIPEQVTHL
jgi:hypothetical protein